MAIYHSSSEVAHVRSSENDTMAKKSLKEISQRKRALANMFTIILTIFIVDTYQTLYSFVKLVWADDECYVFDSHYLWSTSNIIERGL